MLDMQRYRPASLRSRGVMHRGKGCTRTQVQIFPAGRTKRAFLWSDKCVQPWTYTPLLNGHKHRHTRGLTHRRARAHSSGIAPVVSISVLVYAVISSFKHAPAMPASMCGVFSVIFIAIVLHIHLCEIFPYTTNTVQILHIYLFLWGRLGFLFSHFVFLWV